MARKRAPGMRFRVPAGLCANYSQGGVKFPTGGDFHLIGKARERLQRMRRVKQIWCDSRADGYSPEGRG